MKHILEFQQFILKANCEPSYRQHNSIFCVHFQVKYKSLYHHNNLDIVHIFYRLKPWWVYLSRISKHKVYFDLMGHVAPSHHQGHKPVPHFLVSTAKLVRVHLLDTSTGTQPSTQLQRPDYVTDYVTGVPSTNLTMLWLLMGAPLWHYRESVGTAFLLGSCCKYMRQHYIKWKGETF